MAEAAIGQKLVVSVYKDDRIVEGYPPNNMVYIMARKKNISIYVSWEDETNQALMDSLIPPFDDIIAYPLERFCGFEYADFFKERSKKLLSKALTGSCCIPNEYVPKVLDEIYLVFGNVFPRKIRMTDIVGLAVNVTIVTYVRAPPDLMTFNADFYRVKPASRIAIQNLEKVLIEDLDGSCVICTENMETGIEAIKMPCTHYFHSNCIRRWLLTSHFCPLCRFKLAVE